VPVADVAGIVIPIVTTTLRHASASKNRLCGL
jgi:hypothetical protein